MRPSPGRYPLPIPTGFPDPGSLFLVPALPNNPQNPHSFLGNRRVCPKAGYGGWRCLQDDLALPLCDQEDRRWTPSHRSSDTGTENSALKPLLSPAARTTCAAPLPILYQPATFLAVHFRVPGNTLLCHVHEAGLSGSPRIQKFTLRQAASWPIYL